MLIASIWLHLSESMIDPGRVQWGEPQQELLYVMDIKYVYPLSSKKKM